MNSRPLFRLFSGIKSQESAQKICWATCKMKQISYWKQGENPHQTQNGTVNIFYSTRYCNDRSTADTGKWSSPRASVGLQRKACRDLSNPQQLLRQKWKFDIPLLYKGYLPPASSGVFCFSFYKRKEKSLLHHLHRVKTLGKWRGGRKRKELNLTHFPADNAKRQLRTR